jgi:hypothetical protein
MTNTNLGEGIHITLNPGAPGWVAQANGEVLSQHKDKRTAIKSGRLVAKRHATQFTIHRKDGTVIHSHSYAVSPV